MYLSSWCSQLVCDSVWCWYGNYVITKILKYLRFEILKSQYLRHFAKTSSFKSNSNFQWSHQIRQAWVISVNWKEVNVPKLPIDLSTTTTGTQSVSSNFFQVRGLYGVWPNSHLKALRAKKFWKISKDATSFFNHTTTVATLPQMVKGIMMLIGALSYFLDFSAGKANLELELS